MPDDIFGHALPKEQLPNRKRQLKHEDQRTLDDRVTDCLNFPVVYELAELLPTPNPSARNTDYPLLVYLLLATLTAVKGSKRSTLGLLSPKQWGALRGAVRRHAGRRAVAQIPDVPPTYDQYDYAESTYLAPHADLLQEAFEHHALRQALNQDLFPADTRRIWHHPQRRQLLVGDGTIPKAPSKSEAAFRVNTATGEITRTRFDPAAHLYYQNGEDKKTPVRGTKWFFASARDDGYFKRVILAYRHVPGTGYDDEAHIAVRTIQGLVPHLPGCMGVVYDGAFRGVHRDALARRGLLVINKQHDSLVARHYQLLRPGRCRHDLWTDQGRIAERLLLDDGTTFLTPVPVLRLERRPGKSRCRWYHLLAIPCRHGTHEHRIPVGITTTPDDHRLHTPDGKRLPSDTERDFHRAEHLQQIPEITAAHQNVYSYRSDAESVNSQLDASFWNGRMISYGLDRQKIYILGFALSQNATSHQIHRESTPLNVRTGEAKWTCTPSRSS
ncbi:hypothetical protein OG211_14745 [Streptomyces niveus]|uniref:hypothetical protein n=1 Tax=Streptomyces niveus TaxID=193462 RepID=UPI003866963F|nr:hypothetical protein OG211_14745 [Streptomyces niveus]